MKLDGFYYKKIIETSKAILYEEINWIRLPSWIVVDKTNKFYEKKLRPESFGRFARTFCYKDSALCKFNQYNK